MRRAFFFAAFICASHAPLALAKQATDALPIPDGAYLRDGGNRCQMLKAGELDMIDFTTENDGRSFSYPEVGCVVSNVKRLSSTRYVVKANCQEAGELSQTQAFLDVMSKGKIRLDGEGYEFCNWKRFDVTYPAATSKDKTPASIKKLIEQWADQEEGCRGGSGDSPETDKACGKREVLSKKLKKVGWCYGEGNQSLSEQEWHKCKGKK